MHPTTPTDVPDLLDWATFEAKPDLRLTEYNFRRHVLGGSSLAIQAPINEYDALMRCAPGDHPEPDQTILDAIRDEIAEAIDNLEPRDRFVIEAVHAERLSYRELGERMSISKPYAHKLVRQAERRLRYALASSPTLKEYLMPVTTWNTAALVAVRSLSPVGVQLTDEAANDLIERKVQKLRDYVNAGADDARIGQAITSIGVAATHMLSNRGAWDEIEMMKLLCRKQHDYGHGNILAFGLVGVAVRCSDKVARWQNLAGREGHAEPAIDALIDMVGYAAITIMLLNGTFRLELETAEDWGITDEKIDQWEAEKEAEYVG